MARAQCASCGARIRAKDRFCPECGTPIAAAQAAPHTTTPTVPLPQQVAPLVQEIAALPQQSASLQVPVASARALAEQRKIVTILFADLSGSTPLAEKLDPEDLRGILGRYFNALARQIQRYEGTIDKYIGDAIMCVFGAPISHEDDAERAIRAALAMQGAIQRLNDDLEREHGVRLALRIGVNTGEVVAGMLGGDVQQAYTVVGDAVNTAQRFESVAPLNEILVSESTRRIAMHSFEFETLPPVLLKGKAAPVAAFRVLRPRDEEIPPEASEMVGREPELERLRSALGAALTGKGKIVSIIGDPGVGKSRLLAEFKANLAAGVDRISARCASYETNTPYALIADLVRGAFRIHATSEESVARDALVAGFERYGGELDETSLRLVLDVIGYGERSTLDVEQKRGILVRILRGLLEGASHQTAFVIGADDLHWIDSASAAVLTELARDVPRLPCLLITTARPGWEPPWPAEVIRLEPLGEDDTRALIEDVLDHTATDAFVRTIRERSGGNPFFVEELVRSVGDHGSTTELPPSVQDVLEARIERLADGPARTLRSASVIGVTFWYRLLEPLLPDEPTSSHIADLEQKSFVVARQVRPELTYAFRQPLIQEVAYQTQLLSERRATHGAVGAAIETLYPERTDEFVDMLAYHYERGNVAEKALYWLVRAADRAKSLFANAEALTLFDGALRRAVDGAGPLGAGSILERMGEVQQLIGRFDEAIASFRKADERKGADDPAASARLRRRIAIALRGKGEYPEALALLDEARVLAGEAEDELARVRVQAGMVHFLRGDYAAARPELDVAIALAERRGLDEVIAEGLKLVGNIGNNVGALVDAEAAYQRSVAIYERLSDLVGIGDVRSNLGSVYRRMGRWEDSLREYEASLAIRERIGHRRGIATCHNNIGEVHRTRGEPRLAIPAYERAAAILEEIGASADAAVVRMNLGAAHLELGEVARALAELTGAEERFQALGRFKFLPELYMHLARAALLAGQYEVATGHADRSLELARLDRVVSQEGMTLRIQGEIALARGQAEVARGWLEKSRAILADLGEDAELARTEELLARLGTRPDRREP